MGDNFVRNEYWLNKTTLDQAQNVD